MSLAPCRLATAAAATAVSVGVAFVGASPALAVGGNAAVSSLAASSVTVEAGNPVYFAVYALDSASGGVSGAVPRLSVTSGPNAGAGPLDCTMTDPNGQAQCSYPTTAATPNAGAGTDTVTLWVDSDANGTSGPDISEPRTTVQINVTPAPDIDTSHARNVRLSPTSAVVPSGARQQLTATVTTATGAPTVGLNVTFTVNGVGRFVDGSRTAVVQTNRAGTATVTSTSAAQETGSQTLMATIPNPGTECAQAAAPGTPAGNCVASASLTFTAQQPTASPQPSPYPTASPQPSPYPTPRASAVPSGYPSPMASPAPVDPETFPVADLAAEPRDGGVLLTWTAPAGALTPEYYLVGGISQATGQSLGGPDAPGTAVSYRFGGMTNGDLVDISVTAVYLLPSGGSRVEGTSITVAASETAAPLPPATEAFASYDPETSTTVSTGGGAAPTASDPVDTRVEVPAGATGSSVSIAETTPTDTAPSGYAFFGQQVDIVAPVATADSPLRLTFAIDQSLIPPGTDPSTITLVRSNDGPAVTLVDCTDSSGTAAPDPCIASRSVTEGDVTLVVLTSHASHWNTAVVLDQTAPVLSSGPYVGVTEATGALGAVVTFTRPTATDAVDGSVPVSCTHSSGENYPMGSTSVQCTATDAAANSASVSFPIVVRDTTAPVVTVPSTITVDAVSPSGARVAFSPTARDVVDGATQVTCTPASGSTFAIGSRVVVCTSTDLRGNVGSARFTIVVRSARQQVDALVTMLQSIGVNSLTAKAQAAADSLAAGRVTPARQQLQALRKHASVEADNRRITSAQGSTIVSDVDRAIATLGP